MARRHAFAKVAGPKVAGAGWLAAWLLICSAIVVVDWTGPAQAELMSRTRSSDDEIRRQLIQQSIASCPGPCACPYNIMRNGRQCGQRSAYVKPGGYSPKCYPDDVSATEVAAWRARSS